MTNRAEFQHERPVLPEHYLELIAAAERVIYYKCECAAPNPKLCTDCVYGPLRTTLKRIITDRTNTIPAVHNTKDVPLEY